MRFYLAGPYTPKDCSLHDAARIAQQNTLKAIRVANELIKKGHVVFIPHLSHFHHVNCTDEINNEYWYRLDDTIIKHWAEALFFIAPSGGANKERQLASKLGLTIYYELGQVPYEIL